MKVRSLIVQFSASGKSKLFKRLIGIVQAENLISSTKSLKSCEAVCFIKCDGTWLEGM